LSEKNPLSSLDLAQAKLGLYFLQSQKTNRLSALFSDELAIVRIPRGRAKNLGPRLEFSKPKTRLAGSADAT
jgi:hypothetical protein